MMKLITSLAAIWFTASLAIGQDFGGFATGAAGIPDGSTDTAPPFYINTTTDDLWVYDGVSAWFLSGPGTAGAWDTPVDAIIRPDGDGTRDFGLTGTRFAVGYFDDLDVTDTLTMGGTQHLKKGADVASATELLVLLDGNYFVVTGTTTIATIEDSADAFQIGAEIVLQFADILQLTDSGDLTVLGNANYTTAAGDTTRFRKTAAGDWTMTSYALAAIAPAADMLVSVYDAAGHASQVVTETDTQTLTNKTLSDFTNTISANSTIVQVRNSSGSTLTGGTPVHVSGYHVGQDLVEVEEADATDVSAMPAMGLIATDILNNANGGVIVEGTADGVDTSSFSVGDVIYVSETTGALTATRPTGVAIAQSVGTVLRDHMSQGVFDIKLSQPFTGLSADLIEDGTAADMRTTIGVSSADSGSTLGVAAVTFAITTSFATMTGDGGGNTVATITGGYVGLEITLLFVDALIIITDTDAATADTVDLSAAFTSADDTTLKLIYNGTKWFETGRKVN